MKIATKKADAERRKNQAERYAKIWATGQLHSHGLNAAQIADCLGVSKRTAERYLVVARMAPKVMISAMNTAIEKGYL